MTHLKRSAFTFLMTLVLVSCGQPESESQTDAESVAEAADSMDRPMDLRAQLMSDVRSVEDRARDAGRKPAEVLEYLGVEPGMNVIDLMAAGGWYSEVLSLAVGPEGSVTAQNPAFLLALRDGAMGVALNERVAGRLTNVTRMDSIWDEVGASGAQYDVAMSALNLHDAYLQSPEYAAAMMSGVFAALKPGGVFGVIEHSGNADVDMEALHRMDKDIAIELAVAAGFEVEGDSDLLSNREDDLTQNVFAEGIRGKTDRFLLKLRKPGN